MIILIVMLFFASNLEELFVGKKTYIVYFSHEISGGIAQGTDVQFAGKNVGVVTDVDVNEDHHVEVTITIDESIAIRTDAKVTIRSVGLLGGEKYMQISPGTPQAPLLDTANVIPGEETVAIQALLEVISQVAMNTQRITTTVDHLLASGDQPGELMITLHMAQTLINDVNTTISNVNRVLNKNEQDIHTIVNQAAHLTNQMNGLLAANRGKIDTTIATVQAGVEQIPQLLSDVRTVLANVQDISEKIKRGEGTAGQMIMDETLHLRIQQLLDSTEDLVQHVKTNGIRVRIF
ncbi:MAG: MlaD family protein [Gemmatimonadota bacterium]|nr:MlaD family protein [Gemmatimonadota bacterium]